MKTVSVAQAATAQEAVLPARVQEALGELVGAAKEGLLALSVGVGVGVGVGLGVLAELMDEEVCEVVGPKGRHDRDRSAVRHHREDGSVTLGGRRVPIKRPRARSADGSEEVPLATYAHFADRDALTGVVLERMLAGVSTRRCARTQEPVDRDIRDILPAAHPACARRRGGRNDTRPQSRLGCITDRLLLRSRGCWT